MKERFKSSALISFGCGVNSVAMIILLYCRNFRFPIVFADTGVEKIETYEYLCYFNNFMKETFETQINIISPYTHMHLYEKRIREHQLHTIEKYCYNQGAVPMICARWCTSGYKRDPIRRWGKENSIFTHLIGYAADESSRAKVEKDGKYYLSYPLIDEGITRKDCINIIQRVGLYVPEKSGCFFCPFQKEKEWRYLKLNDSDRWKRAKNIEKNASIMAERKITILSNFYSLKDYENGWKQENPLFPYLIDHSRHQCPYCRI